LQAAVISLTARCEALEEHLEKERERCEKVSEGKQALIDERTKELVELRERFRAPQDKIDRCPKSQPMHL